MSFDREHLAGVQHEIWSHWMRYMFGRCETGPGGSAVIPAALVRRWRRQMETAYTALPEAEREGDREQADRVLAACGRAGKYAREEWERRFLVAEPPADLEGRPFRRITDRYLPGTRLRLRRVEDSGGAAPVFKLAMKASEAGTPAARTLITNLYLDVAEHARLEALPADVLVKRRYRWGSPAPIAIDVFEGVHAGLVLCEIETPTEAALRAVPVPPFAGEEVTGEAAFTGGHLAGLTAAALRAAFAARGT